MGNSRRLPAFFVCHVNRLICFSLLLPSSSLNSILGPPRLRSETRRSFLHRELHHSSDQTLSAEGFSHGENSASARWDIEIASPSKINLFLRVVARRDDGCD